MERETKWCGKVPVVLADNGFDVIVVAVDPEPVLDGAAFVAYDFGVDPDDYNLDQPVPFHKENNVNEQCVKFNLKTKRNEKKRKKNPKLYLRSAFVGPS